MSFFKKKKLIYPGETQKKVSIRIVFSCTEQFAPLKTDQSSLPQNVNVVWDVGSSKTQMDDPKTFTDLVDLPNNFY